MSLAERFAERRQNDRLREVGEQVQQRLVDSVGPRLSGRSRVQTMTVTRGRG